MTKAVIDVGSNSVLLLVATRSDKGWESVLETSKVTGLGKGTKTSGLLSEEGMRSTLTAVRAAFDDANRLGATSISAAATMAARIATNAPEFLARASQQDTPVFVLSGEDEAALGSIAVTSDPVFSSEERLSIVDVGGHSTEITTMERSPLGWQSAFRRSFGVGALGLREGPLEEDSPSLSARLSAVVEIDDTLGLRYRPHESGTVVTLGATGTNLVSVRERMQSWDPAKVHGAWLGYEEVGKAVGMLCDLDDSRRATLIGIEPGREHTIHAGALILERCLFALGAEGCRVSVRGWRYGLLETNSTPNTGRV